MRDQEALELIDAHLDDGLLTDQQIDSLTQWLKDNPQHAERAFHRIFLHTFLRRRLQAQRLIVRSERTTLIPLEFAESETVTDLLIANPETSLRRPQKRAWSKWLLVACGLLLALVAVGSWIMREPEQPPLPVADIYEGFDYPPTLIPASDPVNWPITGGLQGLAGGVGWAEPWQENGPKVAVIVDHARETNWDPKDMRKFKPLGYTDAQGRVLKTSGLQMRTAMGPRSWTSRKLDLSVFPSSMSDEAGLGCDGAVLWISFLAQSSNSTAANNRFSYFQIGSREVSGFRLGKVGAAPSGNWTALGLLTGAQVNLRSSAVPSGEAAFLVTRLEFLPDAEDVAVWINPNLGTEPRIAESTLRLSVPDFRFDAITINGNFSTDFDEIRIGQSFLSIAPTE